MRVLEVRVAPVDNDVALFQQGLDLGNDRVDRTARLDHQHHFARARKRSDHLRRGRQTRRLRFLRHGDELVHLGGGAVVNSDLIAVVV